MFSFLEVVIILDGIFERIIPLRTHRTGQSPQRTVRSRASSNLANNSFPFFLPPLPLPLTFFLLPSLLFLTFIPNESQQGVA